MRKILTAIGNSNLNNEIKEMENYKILSEDITNDNKLLEFLETEERVDVLFLCTNIICDYKPVDFINLIRKIHKNIFIVFFVKEKIENNIQVDNRLKIFYEINIDLQKLEKDFDNKKIIEIEKNDSKVIAISGANGVGKTIFSTLLAQNVEKLSNKVLLIDFDLDENHIKTILKTKSKLQRSSNIKDFIISIDKNFDVLSDLNLFFQDIDDVNFFTIQKMLNEFREEYDFIIIDTSSNIDKEYTKKIFYNSDEIIFLVEPNILGIKKMKDMIEVIEIDWKISNEKINIVINKNSSYELSESIIYEIFPKIKIVGKIKYRDEYNLFINKNIVQKAIEEEYKIILKKME